METVIQMRWPGRRREAEIRRAEVRHYETEVLNYLARHKYLDFWSSIGAAGLLRRKIVKATRKGLTLNKRKA